MCKGRVEERRGGGVEEERGGLALLCVSRLRALSSGPECLLSVDMIRGLEEVKELERVFLSTSVSPLPAAAAALKET